MGRVLVVDDDTDVRAALKMLLEDDGHSIVELEDGLNVAEVVEEQRIDVVLLDLSMPQVNGFEVLSMLLLNPASANVPVIVVSARGRPDDKAQAMALGASDYVNKPWGEGEVEFRVRMALGRSQRKWAEENGKPPEETTQLSAAPAVPAAPVVPTPATPIMRPLAPPTHLQRSRPAPPAGQPAAPRQRQPAPSRAARPERPMRRPAPAAAPHSGNPPAPAPRPAQPAAANGAAPIPLRRRTRVRRIVRHIRRRAA